MARKTSQPIVPLYSSKIIKAGALLPDTRILLAAWDDHASVEENLDRALQRNVFGKASRARVANVLRSFKLRYLADREITKGVLTLFRDGFPTESLDRVLYFLTLQSDPLLHDAVTAFLVPFAQQGRQEVAAADMARWVQAQSDQGRTTTPWNAETIERVSQGIMSTLRDFGILTGSVTKRVAPVYLPVPAFCFVAYLLFRQQPSGDRLVHDPSWQVFFLTPLAVERSLAEAHQERLLEYHAAGRIMRINFPAQSVEEYAHALTQRAH